MAEASETTLQALAARIEALEMRSAHQDDVIDELNEVIVDQWSKLDRALRRLQGLEKRLADVQDAGASGPRDEPPPPHY